MRQYSILLLAVALLATACSKSGRRSQATPMGREVAAPATPSSTPFVTERPVIEAPKIETVIPSERSVITAPLRFPDNETQHVRIVYYNPFGDSDRISVDLKELQRSFCYPYPGNKLSDYGLRGRTMHTGVDIKAIPNDTIRAALDGVVRMSKLYSSYGNVVVLRHPFGLETVYAHNSKNLVEPNQMVRAGDPIALAGRTGRATTEHLHFEVRIMGEHFDPNLFLDTDQRSLQSKVLYLTRSNGRILASHASERNRGSEERAAAMTIIAPPAETSATNPPPPTPPLSEVPSSVTSGAAPGSSTANATATPRMHVVERGDTLYSISRKYGLTVDHLCEVNGISRDGVLSIGQKLKIQ